MICIKCDEKIFFKPKKPKFWTFEVFKVFFEAIFQP